MIVACRVEHTVVFSNAASKLRLLTVSSTGLGEYSSIQEAINNASDGDIILVRSDIYYENLVVNKSVSIIGEDQSNTIIDGGGKDITVIVKASGAMLKNLTIQHGIVGVIFEEYTEGNQLINSLIAYNSYYGVYGDRCGKSTIANNTICFNGWHGIFLYASGPCVIENNTITSNNADGVRVRYSNNTVIQNNVVSLNVGCGIFLMSDEDPERPSGLSRGNVINYNCVLNNSCGIKICHFGNDTSLAGNWIRGNYIAYNGLGLNLSGSRGNTFYNNNFVENLRQLSVFNTSGNSWDAGYYIGGNFWSDYEGVDNFCGPDQSQLGSDGCGDSPYLIDADNVDYYPLMGPTYVFNVGTLDGKAYALHIASNSSVTNFKLDILEKTVSFNVNGAEDTVGFCRITIPNIIIEHVWQHDYSILLNSEPWPFSQWADAKNTCIYISYKHPEHKISIVFEFPSTIVLSAYIILAMLTAVLAKKRFSKKTMLNSPSLFHSESNNIIELCFTKVKVNASIR